MMGPTHRIFGAHFGFVSGAFVGGLQGPISGVMLGSAWAWVGWYAATGPDRLEAPLRVKHRGLTHWPEPPLLLFLAAVALLPWPLWVIVGGFSMAFLSHWVGDVVFGKAFVSKDGDGKIIAVLRPRGAPYLFGTRYYGVGFKVDGEVEHMMRKFLLWTFPLNVIIMMYLLLTFA